jgi:hypothetical protein
MSGIESLPVIPAQQATGGIGSSGPISQPIRFGHEPDTFDPQNPQPSQAEPKGWLSRMFAPFLAAIGAIFGGRYLLKTAVGRAIAKPFQKIGSFFKRLSKEPNANLFKGVENWSRYDKLHVNANSKTFQKVSSEFSNGQKINIYRDLDGVKDCIDVTFTGSGKHVWPFVGTNARGRRILVYQNPETKQYYLAMLAREVGGGAKNNTRIFKVDWSQIPTNLREQIIKGA